MKIENKLFLAGAMLAAFMLPAVAQESTATTPVDPAVKPKTGPIQNRKENQQQRIGQGVENGSLTAGETKTIEKQEAGLNKEEKAMRAEDGGKLTAADRAKLNNQQNHLSKEIYRDKHNANVQNTDPKSEVGKRQREQQERIGQGIASGQLTAGEAANLESKDARINKEIHNDRAANGGKLTAGEKAQINRQQNHVSRQIYRKKHNGRTR